jgi:hypothetical protein
MNYVGKTLDRVSTRQSREIIGATTNISQLFLYDILHYKMNWKSSYEIHDGMTSTTACCMSKENTPEPTR